MLKYDHIVRAMTDRFFIVIEATDGRYQAAGTRSFLQEIGGKDLVELED